MNFLRKCLLFFILIYLCLVLYLFLPNTGYVDIAILNYKFHSDIYIVVSVLIVAIFVKSIIKGLIKIIKSFCKKSDEKLEMNAIKNLARLIVLNDLFDGKNIDDKFNLCKIAVSVNSGNIVPDRTGIEEVDIRNIKNKMQLLMQSNNLDKAIGLANEAINYFPHYLSVIQDELLQVAVTAVSEHKSFEFNPARSKYKLSREFIDKYNIKKGLAIVETTSDVSIKLKLLENLYKNYNNDINILSQLLLTLASEGSDKRKTLKLIEKIFKMKPDRKLATVFLEVCEKSSTFDEAENLLKSVPHNNVEKLWFLLIVAVKTRHHSKVVELVRSLSIDEINKDELRIFFTKNYDILSSNDDVVKLICG